MISLPQRQQMVQWVEQASAAGARRHQACELLGIAPTHAAALAAMRGVAG